MTARLKSMAFWRNALLYVGSAVLVGYIAAQLAS